MMEAAGLGIAYRAKPKVEEAADAAIRHTDLTAALYALGIHAGAFASAPSDHAEADTEHEGAGGEEGEDTRAAALKDTENDH